MPNPANRFAAAKPIPLAPPVITAARPSANAGCCGMLLLLLPARSNEVDHHVFALRKAVGDDTGRRTRPPAPAFQQIIRGADFHIPSLPRYCVSPYAVAWRAGRL